jgi:hypothetical protein
MHSYPDSTLNPPMPPPAVVIGGLLRLVALGREPIASSTPWAADRVHLVELRSLWLLEIDSDADGNPSRLRAAIPPDIHRQPWRWGCERNDWRLGPDSEPVNPMAQLTTSQRDRLRVRLERAPRPLPIPEWFELADDDPDLILD